MAAFALPFSVKEVKECLAFDIRSHFRMPHLQPHRPAPGHGPSTIMQDNLVLRLGTALALGFVVGLERGWRERDAVAGSRTAGVRTFGLTALLGAIVGSLADALSSPSLVGVAFLGFAGVFAWFKVREADNDHEFSVTSVVAALIVFALGALCVVGDPQVAGAGGVATASVLASRDILHGWLARLTWTEIRSALLLLAMSVIVLPLLPNTLGDQFYGVNPREIWLFTVLTAVISSVGYVAVKLAGPSKGILISGLAGALASSTAVTIAFARRAAAGEQPALLAGGAALAGLVSILRVTVIVAVAAPSVLPYLLSPALPAAAVFGLGGLLLIRRKANEGAVSPILASPFDLQPILLFAASFAVVAAVGGWLTQRFGTGGILVTSGVFGLLDVDVATLTATRLAGTAITASTAAQAILLALGVNAAARVVYAAALGPLSYAGRLLLVTFAALSIGAIIVVAQALNGSVLSSGP